MKTYKYLYKAILILLLLSSYLTHSQIRPSEFFKRQWLDLDSDASLCCTPLVETLDDFSFNWDYNYNTAFNNLALLEQAKLDELESWYRKQYNLIQDEIEKQLNTSFSSYDQAKKAFFSDIEGKNITRNTPVLLSKYKKLYNPGRNKNRKYLKELKHLQLREIEIRAGNRYNSQFPYLQAKGVSLKEITSLSKLSELKYDLENAFGNQISINHEYVYIIEKLDYLGSDFDNEMLNLKNKFYKSFDRWDQLGLMQYLLNYEYYKDILSPPYSTPVELVEFQYSDMATEPVIEEYAKNNRGGGVSLFDPRYPEINRYLYQNNFCGGYIDLMAWEADKQAALDGYIDNVSTTSLATENLNNLLKYEPFRLIEIDCNQIVKWQSLAQHTPPQSIINKVKNLQENHEALLGDWNIQYLESAGGKVVNMDYFSVNITTLPINPNTGQRYTSVQFLDYFRRNINNFVTGTNFSPYCEISAICQQETNLWNSSNPLGAIIKLDISLYNGPGGNILANDGIVISAENTANYWRFMTMEAPYDSEHPVTGTRQFGIEQNANGSYNIYVRGVDRFTSRIQEATLDIFTDPFLFADSLWESFQDKTNQFINSNGGVSSINTPITNRPNWNKVKEILEGSRPISDLGCN